MSHWKKWRSDRAAAEAIARQSSSDEVNRDVDIDAMFDKSDEVASSNDPDVASLSDHQNDEISGSNENEFEPPTGQSSSDSADQADE